MTMYKCSLNDLSEASVFEPIPDGSYNAHLVEDTLKKSKKTNVAYYRLKFKICDGKYKGRAVFKSLFLHHPNNSVRGYSQAFLKQLLVSTNTSEMHDFEEFKTIPICIHVGIKEGTSEYPNSQNEIYGVGKEKKELRDKPFENDFDDDIPVSF